MGMITRAPLLALLAALFAATPEILAASEGSAPTEPEAQPSARELVEAAIDLTRGVSSYAELSMTIHRPSWERSSTLKAWTQGREDALIRFTAPARDAGNATLKLGENMWTFTPKLNRVVRLPFSLMSQSWAGSDFSYHDLSRTDDLLRHYELAVVKTIESEGHTVYTVEAVPHDDAPVVWGKEVLELRDDHVLLEHTFFDQALTPLKRLEAIEIRDLGGRTFATRARMIKLDEPNHWTELTYHDADFGIELDDSLFTVFSLESGREP